MRKFYIEADGTRYDLNTKSLLLTGPEGLGWTSSEEYEGVQELFFTHTENSYKISTITADLSFLGSNVYAAYNTTVGAWMKASKLVFIYNPNGTEYRRDVSIKYVTKTDCESPCWLKCPISFNLLSPWYTSRSYSSGMALSNQLGADFDIEIICESVTTLKLSVNNSVVLGLSLESYTGIVEITGKRGNFSVKDIDGNDLIDSVDLSVTTLPELVSDSTLTLSTTVTSGTATINSATVRQYFRSV